MIDRFIERILVKVKIPVDSCVNKFGRLKKQVSREAWTRDSRDVQGVVTSI